VAGFGQDEQRLSWAQDIASVFADLGPFVSHAS